MDAVSDQSLGLANDAQKKLEACEQKVEGGADQRHSSFNPVFLLKSRVHLSRAPFRRMVSKSAIPKDFQRKVPIRVESSRRKCSRL
jgi:hypothetical protein